MMWVIHEIWSLSMTCYLANSCVATISCSKKNINVFFLSYITPLFLKTFVLLRYICYLYFASLFVIFRGYYSFDWLITFCLFALNYKNICYSLFTHFSYIKDLFLVCSMFLLALYVLLQTFSNNIVLLAC